MDEEREGEAEAESPRVPGQMRMHKTGAEAEEERAVPTEEAGIATFALPEGEEEGKKEEEEEEAIGEEMEVAIRARTEETDQEIASSHFATSPRWKTWMKSSCASPANCRSWSCSCAPSPCQQTTPCRCCRSSAGSFRTTFSARAC